MENPMLTETIKRTLRFEPYLQFFHRGGIPELAKIRGGTNRLRIEQGRYEKEKVCERICRCCQVEDEFHFMLQCSTYDLRNRGPDLSKRQGEARQFCF